VRNHPLSKLRQGLNQLKSQIRCSIEHIFGYVENSMGGPELEYIGLPRIRTGIGLSNLAYKLLRHVQLIRLGALPHKCSVPKLLTNKVESSRQRGKTER
jgi:transposase, IS5 family